MTSWKAVFEMLFILKLNMCETKPLIFIPLSRVPYENMNSIFDSLPLKNSVNFSFSSCAECFPLFCLQHWSCAADLLLLINWSSGLYSLYSLLSVPIC